MDETILSKHIKVVRAHVKSGKRLPKAILNKRFPLLPDWVKISELPISVRTFNGLSRAGLLNNHKALAKFTIRDFLRLKNIGLFSLLDLLQNLNETFKTLDSNSPEPNDECILEATILRSLKQSDSIRRNDIRFGEIIRSIDPMAESVLHLAERLLTNTTHFQDVDTLTSNLINLRKRIEEAYELKLEDEILSLLPSNANSRDSELFISRYGLNGCPAKTLQEIGDKYLITRERVRQICERIECEFREKICFTPILDRALVEINKALPNMTEDIEIRLLKLGLTRSRYSIDSIRSAAELTKKQIGFEITSHGNSFLVTASETPIDARSILRLADRTIEHWGVATVDFLVERLSAKNQTISKSLVTRLVKSRRDFHWLCEANGWFWLSGVKRNRLVNKINKILDAVPSMDLANLREGVRRHYRMKGFAPPNEILHEFCRQQSDLMVDGNQIIRSKIEKHKKNKPGMQLSHAERTMVDVLNSHGSVMAREDFEKECLKSGVTRATFYVYLDNSPAIKRFAKGVYGVRGAQISPLEVESLRPKMSRSKVIKDFGWTNDGYIWVSYILSEGSVSHGVLGFPAALSSYLSDSFTISETGKVVRIIGSCLSGLGSTLRRLKFEKGNHIILTFDLKMRVVRIRRNDS